MLNDELIARALNVPGWVQENVLARLEGHPAEDACWEWTGYRNSQGYGLVSVSAAATGGVKAQVRVHRVVWLALVGPITDGMVLDHDSPSGCSNRACANPAHLTVSTAVDNVRATGRSWAARKAQITHCPRGHALADGNLRPRKDGHRECLTCSVSQGRARHDLIREARLLLGLPHVEYRATYGQSRIAALSILSSHS